MKLFFSCTSLKNQPVAPIRVRPEVRPLTPSEINQNLEIAFMQMGIPPRELSSADESVNSAVQAIPAKKTKRAMRG
jgi:hypothetical protein